MDSSKASRTALWISLLAVLVTAPASWAADRAPIPEPNLEEMGVTKTLVTAEKAEKIACLGDEETFCFLGGRFEVKVDWRNFEGETGTAKVVEQPVSDNSGVFYFFTAGNWEMLVKVLDGCDLNDRFWVFSAATTNVEYTLNVRDTVTGTTAVYQNPLGNNAAALTDTDALPVCTP